MKYLINVAYLILLMWVSGPLFNPDASILRKQLSLGFVVFNSSYLFWLTKEDLD